MILRKILDETCHRMDRGIPCLIGDSQWGKTRYVSDWSKENGREMIRLLVQTKEPEAICGYDVKNPKTGDLQHALASWARKIKSSPKDKKFTLFVDELDKPREAALSSILTLMCDGIVEDYNIMERDVAIVAAMNVPRAPLPDPLVNRLLFIAYPSELEHMTSGLKKMRSIASEYLEMPKAAFPERKKNKGIIHRLESWMDCMDFWKDEAFRHTIITGLVPHKDIAYISTRLDPKAFVGIDGTMWAQEARPSDLRDMLINLLNADKDQQKRYDILKVLCDRANADPTSEFSQALATVAERMHEVQ